MQYDSQRDRLRQLRHVLQEFGPNKDNKCVVFVNKYDCDSTKDLQRLFESINVPSVTCYGDKRTHDVEQCMNRFRDGTALVLISTDIMARGIDIADVNLVINYDTPKFAVAYVHRLGRTGRMKNKGNAITMISVHRNDYHAAVIVEIHRHFVIGDHWIAPWFEDAYLYVYV